MEWIVDICKNCDKMRLPGDIYFCGGCGFGSMNTEDSLKWKEIMVSNKES